MRKRYSEMPAKQTAKKAQSPRVFGQRRKHPKMFRVGLYARVSTFDQHTIPLQIRALREYAARRGWTIALQVKEVGSGAARDTPGTGPSRRRFRIADRGARSDDALRTGDGRTTGCVRGVRKGDSAGTRARRSGSR